MRLSEESRRIQTDYSAWLISMIVSQLTVTLINRSGIRIKNIPRMLSIT